MVKYKKYNGKQIPSWIVKAWDYGVAIELVDKVKYGNHITYTMIAKWRLVWGDYEDRV